MQGFFQGKREWSKYKDLILGYYLHPYIPKLAKLRKKILIVDCCAGPGRFEDGSYGSPLIIAEEIMRWRDHGIDVSGVFVEEMLEHFSALNQNLKSFGDAAATRHGKFGDYLKEIQLRAATETVFLYVDPYSIKGLEFSPMKAVYDQIHHSGASVEVLMNFNVTTFMRWALAAMKRAMPNIDDDDPDYLADDPNERVEIRTLNAIAGGDYWQEIALGSLPFHVKLDDMIEAYASRLGEAFEYVCWYAVKSKYKHKVPKYMLIYGTRHPDGLELMNDAMCKAREEFLGAEFDSPEYLFPVRPERELPDLEKLENDMLAKASVAISRKALRLEMLKLHFCRYSKPELNRVVKSLIDREQLISSTGRSKINDDVMLTTA